MSQHWNIPHTLPTWLQLIFTCSVNWNQHWRGGTFVMLLTSFGMLRRSWKAFHKMAGILPTPLYSLVEVYNCTKWLFWRKCSFTDCTFLYFSELKLFGAHFEATTYVWQYGCCDLKLYVHVYSQETVLKFKLLNPFWALNRSLQQSTTKLN